jgi:hypothetical protein
MAISSSVRALRQSRLSGVLYREEAASIFRWSDKEVTRGRNAAQFFVEIGGRPVGPCILPEVKIEGENTMITIQ